MFRKSDKPALKSKAPGTAGPSAATAPDPAGKVIPPGKQAYEARRAAKAGVSLDRWMADKQKRAQAEVEAARRVRARAEPVKRGFFKRLLDRAHKPL